MQVIPQTHFIPLPDAVCSIIMDLNMRRIVATLEMVLEKLSVLYKDMTVPSQQLVFDTLGSLIRERKVFHTGESLWLCDLLVWLCHMGEFSEGILCHRIGSVGYHKTGGDENYKQ